MVKVSYHVLGAIFFVIGVSLEIHLPGQDATLGYQLFEQYSLDVENSFGIPMVRIVSAIFQIIGVMFFLKWLSDEHPQLAKKMRKLEPIILAVLIFGSPLLFNELFDTSARTYAYSGEKGADAVEFIKSKSDCQTNNQNGMLECSISLKNYQHHSQPITIHFPYENSSKSNKIVHAYLQVHEQKSIKVSLPPDKIKMIEGKPEFWIETN